MAIFECTLHTLIKVTSQMIRGVNTFAYLADYRLMVENLLKFALHYLSSVRVWWAVPISLMLSPDYRLAAIHCNRNWFMRSNQFYSHLGWCPFLTRPYSVPLTLICVTLWFKRAFWGLWLRVPVDTCHAFWVRKIGSVLSISESVLSLRIDLAIINTIINIKWY